MRYIADLHIHSHYSRATSKTLNPENLSLWAQKKGIVVIGTGDFTHPGWVKELREKLVESDDGLFRLRPELQKEVDAQVPASCLMDTRFLLSGEISCIYKKNGKTRKVHHLILMPDMASVIKLNDRLDQIGNITSDGRPILGLDSKRLLEITLEVDERAFFIPAHVWTPWFSVFGSKSGFDSLEECFEDLTGHIHALETGLSSDPAMNRCLSALDRFTLVSNSDAHSANKLGREANLFDTALSHNAMIQAMTHGHGFLGTIEFYPEEGKYHMDGHRKCQVRFDPAETLAHDGLCPKCGKPLTVGVLNRVFELADRDHPELSKKFFSLVPLPEVLSQLLDCGPATKKVTEVYERLISELGPELQILMDAPLADIEAAGGLLLSEAIDRMRQGKVVRLGGYDGEYGIIKMFDDAEKQALTGQMTLFGASAAPKRSRTPAPRPAKKKTPPKKGKPAESPGCDDPKPDPLNDAQGAAVRHKRGHLMVVAGPGTGKTLTLTHRIAYLVREGMANPEQVLALTFTRKAAKEMGQRLSLLLPGDQPGQLYISTFHGFCLDMLRTYGDTTRLPPDFGLCSEMDVETLVRQCLPESGPGKRLLQRFLKTLPDMKRESLGEGKHGSGDKELQDLFKAYIVSLRDLGMLDLDDLEIETLRLLRDHKEIAAIVAARFPWVFVDEYQDTHPVQAAILKTIISSNSDATLFAIGDPDQAIYGFRGADVSNFSRFEDDFPGARFITLDKNYRSTQPILDSAATVMEKATPLQAMVSEGSPLFYAPCRSDAEEAEMIVEQVERLLGGTSYFSLDSGRVASHEEALHLSLGDMGVLYRLNAQGDALEKAFDRAGLPFVRSGEIPLIYRYPVHILFRFFQTLLYPDNAFYTARYNTLIQEAGLTPQISHPGLDDPCPIPELIDQVVMGHRFELSTEESIGTLDRFKKSAADFKGNLAAFMDFLSLERGIDHGGLLGDRLALMSLHAAKGLEWPVVFLTGCEDKLLPCSLFGDHDREEERRLFYVGMTRAKERLVLSHALRRSLNGRILDMNPSPFLDAIPKDLCKPLDRRGWRPKKRKQEQLTLF